MTETKFKVDIFKKGKHNYNILTLIAAHNGKEVNNTLNDIISYAINEKALYPERNKGLEIFRSGRDNVIYVTEDGGLTFTLVIEEVEFIPLQMPEEETADDLKDVVI